MLTNRLMTGLAVVVAVGIAAGTAQAQNNRSFVSTLGNDSNACTASAFCRTLTRALSQTNSGGEIIIVDSGGYGGATISQAVTISAVGVRASITQATAGAALTISTSGNVTLRGISLFGQGVGTEGISVTQVGTLYLFNMEIEGFTDDGVNFGANGTLAMYDTVSRANGNDGLFVSNATAANAYAHRCLFSHNTHAGVEIGDGGMATITESAANSNGIGYLANASAATATLVVDHVHAIFNATGFETSANAGSALTFAYSLVTENTTNSYNAGAGSSLTGSNPGTTVITGSGTGSLLTGVTLH